MNSEDFKRLEKLFFQSRSEIKEDSRKFKDEIKEEIQQHLTVQREDFQKQLTFIGEGLQMLSEKIDRVAADLSAHRKDTDVHRTINASLDVTHSTYL